MSPEKYASFFNEIVDIAKNKGMEYAYHHITINLSEEESKILLSHIVNAIIEMEKCQVPVSQ